MESSIIEKFLAPSTAARLLLFADLNACALLKESAMSTYFIDPAEFIHGEGWSQLEESPKLLSELLRHTSTNRKSYLPVTRKDDAAREQIDDMDVTSLRERLDKANLHLDGSRNVLIERLNSHNGFNIGTRGNENKRRIIRAKHPPAGFAQPWAFCSKTLAGKTPKEMLLAFYQQYNASKLHTVDQILQKYQGNEEQLFRNLAKKYNLGLSVFGLSSSTNFGGGGGFGSPSQLGGGGGSGGFSFGAKNADEKQTTGYSGFVSSRSDFGIPKTVSNESRASTGEGPKTSDDVHRTRLVNFYTPAPAPTGGLFGPPAVAGSGGSKIAPFNVTNRADGNNATQISFQSITAMQQYEGKSFEEIRFEDYLIGSKGDESGNNSTSTGGFGGFGAPAPKGGFGTAAPACTGGGFSFGSGSGFGMPKTASNESGASTGEGSKTSDDVHRTRLVNFYTKYCPERLKDVDELLKEFKGNEDKMFKRVEDVYKIKVPPAPVSFAALASYPPLSSTSPSATPFGQKDSK